jgi:hypothetical protein
LKPPTIFVLSLLIITLALVEGNLVFALSAPKYYGGAGGTISGVVVSPSGSVVDWAQIHANNSNQTFEAFSGFSGFYLMRVPAGTYNVSVYDFYNPSYWAPSGRVNVTDGSSSTVNFFLQRQPPAVVPEFQPNLSALVSMLALAATCIVMRRLRKPSVSL